MDRYRSRSWWSACSRRGLEAGGCGGGQKPRVANVHAVPSPFSLPLIYLQLGIEYRAAPERTSSRCILRVQEGCRTGTRERWPIRASADPQAARRISPHERRQSRRRAASLHEFIGYAFRLSLFRKRIGDFRKRVASSRWESVRFLRPFALSPSFTKKE